MDTSLVPWLPRDVWRVITVNFPAHSLQRMAMTSRCLLRGKQRVYLLCASLELELEVDFNSPYNWETFGCNERMRKLGRMQLLQHMHHFERVELMQFGDFYIVLNRYCPKLTHCTITGYWTVPRQLRSLLKLFERLQILTIKEIYYKNWNIICQYPMPKMRCQKIGVLHTNEGFVAWPTENAPLLEELVFNMLDKDIDPLAMPDCAPGLCPSLRRLTVQINLPRPPHPLRSIGTNIVTVPLCSGLDPSTGIVQVCGHFDATVHPSN